VATAGVVMASAVVVMVTTGMVVVMMMARPSFCVRSNQAKRRRYSQESTRHRYSSV
jgi:hypothetical protein